MRKKDRKKEKSLVSAEHKLKRQGLSRTQTTVVAFAAAVLIIGIATGAVMNRFHKVELTETKSSENSNYENSYSTVNPPLATTTSNPQLAKEYIYAGSKLLAVEDTNASAAPPADLAVWRPSNGTWYVMGTQSGTFAAAQQWGMAGDLPQPGDYDGDGKTDFAVFRPDNPATAENECQSGCTWYVVKSGDGSFHFQPFGISSDKPAPADYDGDGKTDFAVFRPSTTTWYILRSSDSSIEYRQYGTATDTPTPRDFDGDGRADAAVWRPGNANFYVMKSSDSGYTGGQIGQPGDEPVPADYDGDGKADYAVRSGANWLIRQSSDGQLLSPVNWQQAADKAVPNDYDGDGKVDIAVWRESNGNWYIRKSSNGQLRQEQWGTLNDIPVPVFYRR